SATSATTALFSPATTICSMARTNRSMSRRSTSRWTASNWKTASSSLRSRKSASRTAASPNSSLACGCWASSSRSSIPSVRPTPDATARRYDFRLTCQRPGKAKHFPIKGAASCRFPALIIRATERLDMAGAASAQEKPLGQPEEFTMLRRQLLSGFAVVAAAAFLANPSLAQDTVKIGLIVPMTGQQASTGKQIDAAVKLYQQQHGTTVAGKKIEVILKDDGAVPDNTKRIAQELIVN